MFEAKVLLFMPKKKSRVLARDYQSGPASNELPASQGYVDTLHQETKALLTDLKVELISFKKEVGARFEQVDAKFAQVDARFDRLESELKTEIRSSVARMEALFEKQSNENKYFMDAVRVYIDKHHQLEKRVSHLEGFPASEN